MPEQTVDSVGDPGPSDPLLHGTVLSARHCGLLSMVLLILSMWLLPTAVQLLDDVTLLDDVRGF